MALFSRRFQTEDRLCSTGSPTNQQQPASHASTAPLLLSRLSESPPPPHTVNLRQYTMVADSVYWRCTVPRILSSDQLTVLYDYPSNKYLHFVYVTQKRALSFWRVALGALFHRIGLDLNLYQTLSVMYESTRKTKSKK